MKITDETVEHIANLARLEFEGDEKIRIKEDLDNIITFMEKLQEVDTDNVTPLVFMTNEKNRLRDDVAEVTVSHEEALKNAPKKDSDYFRIPKVLNK